MRLFLISIGIIFVMSNCEGQEHTQGQEQTQVQNQTPANSSNNHKATALEVIQTTSYTYLRVKENNIESWLAVPKMEAEVGAIYYYKGGVEMKDFTSKELGRNFESVFFLGGVSTSPDALKKPTQSASTYTSTAKSTVVRGKISIEPAEDGITIAELFSNKEKYEGKTVKIRGQITKFNAAIMNKNWVHLQDGTEHNNNFDLVATSGKTFKVGDTITITGKIVLNKDFGYGYSYEVMMEDAE